MVCGYLPWTCAMPAGPTEAVRLVRLWPHHFLSTVVYNYVSESERTLACCRNPEYVSYGSRLSQAYVHYYAAFPATVNLAVPAHKWNLHA